MTVFLLPFRLLWWTVTLQLPRRLQLRRDYQLVARSGIFDRAFYLDQNPELAKTRIDPLKHYLTHGACEARDPHPLFDTDWYIERNRSAIGDVNPLIHYLRQGWKQGRDPHPLFDVACYLEQNPDIAQPATEPLGHYISCGALEARSPHPLFDAQHYLRQYPDVAAAHANPLVHYLREGWRHGYNPHALFDNEFYLEQKPELEPSGISPLHYYVLRGALEARSPHPLFDGPWYLRQNPDLLATKANPLVQYLYQGWKEQRNPHVLFDIGFYLEQFTDIGRPVTEPLQHYLKRGAQEKLNPHPLFDGDWYVQQNSDLLASGLNPLVHYLRSGWKDDRSPHRLFDPAFYREQDPTLAMKDTNPLLHYLTCGAIQGLNPNPLFEASYYRSLYLQRRSAGANPLVNYISRSAAGELPCPHPVFDPAFYLSRYPDAKTSGLDALSHYLTIGSQANYSPHPLFNADFYLERNPNVKSKYPDLLQHYLYVGANAGFDPCELFDSSYYLEQYPEVVQSGLNPLSHYLTTGAVEGCRPNPLFDTSLYLKQNPAVGASGINPLVHFILYGAAEGRFPNPFFDPLYYLKRYPDVKRAGTNPLAHYLVRGGAEQGRDPSRFFSTTRYVLEHPELTNSGINPLAHFLGHNGAHISELSAPKCEQSFAVHTILIPSQTGMHPPCTNQACHSIPAVNDSFRAAAEKNCHLLVLLAPVSPDKHALDIMCDVFRVDPNFGAIVPRFADPATGDILRLSASQGNPDFCTLPKGVLEQIPDYYIFPELLASCFLIRDSVLAAIERLDETYESIGGALLQYLCRARRCGFRCVVSNRAVVAAPSAKCTCDISVDRTDVRKLHAEYPDSGLAEAEFAEHSSHIHESLLARFFSNKQRLRPSLLIDVRGVPSRINGTSEAVLGLCDGLSTTNHDWAITLLADKDAAEFHRLTERYPAWPVIHGEAERYFTAAFRPSQPWDIASMMELHRMALFNFYTILDTIAGDILSGAPPGLDATWRFLSDHADGILYISEFTRDRFRVRFPRSEDIPDYVSYLSFDPGDYVIPCVKSSEHLDDFILVVGNSFDHKNVRPTVDLLASAYPSRIIKALGLTSHPSPHVESLEAGFIPQIELDRLYAQASAIVFPSFYEGFGLPILKGLSYGRTVIARESELLFEIAGSYRGPGRLVAFRTPAELVDAVGRVTRGADATEIPLGTAISPGGTPKGWRDVAAGALGFIEKQTQDAGSSRWCARQRAIEQMNAYAT